MKTEQQIQTDIIKKLDALGCYVIKTIINNRAGAPDLIFCCKGLFCAIEVKRAGGKFTELQKFNLKKIRLAGGLTFKDFEEFEKWLRLESEGQKHNNDTSTRD